jgi:prepilin-type N-terminal cleavage/methylation domain-containing protein
MHEILTAADSAPRGVEPQRRVGPPHRSARGFTLIEVLIAAALLLAIAIGVLPLFTRAIISNVEGFDHTRVANAARSRTEQFAQYPFNSERLTLQAGTNRIYDEYYSQRDHIWTDGTEADATADGDVALWTRTTTIQQLNVGDLATPLDFNALPGSVHLKEITVDVRSTRDGGPLGVGKRITVRLFKSQ